MTHDPLVEIARERERARAAGDPLVDACFLATSDASGQPWVRTIILREVDREGFGILISELSPKWRQLRETGRYELLVLWRSINRQYRVQGSWGEMAVDRIEAHWQAKGHGSRLLDHYYTEFEPQSSPIPSREHFLKNVSALKERFPHADEVPQADALKGIVLQPLRIEAWHGSPADRFHDRRLYTRVDTGWEVVVLVP